MTTFLKVTEEWARCPTTSYIARAVRAMHANNATPEQQKAFMVWLNTSCSPFTGLAWDAKDERVSNFLAGRRFVALKIAEILQTPPEAYDATPTRRKARENG